jgi:hypothetical protein
MGGTTVINAPVQAVNVELDEVNGNLRMINDHPLISMATPFVGPVLGSPVFQNALYTSGDTPTQFSEVPPVLTVLRQTATCVPTGFTGCNYYSAPNSHGTCCRFTLVNLGPFTNGLVGAVITDINGNVITAKDISTFLFPNTYLSFGDRRDCCVLGFHTYFNDPTVDPEPRWVLNYSSWITPGLFGAAFLDVTDLSHELPRPTTTRSSSATVHNLTPWWLAPNGNRQDDLEQSLVLGMVSEGAHRDGKGRVR